MRATVGSLMRRGIAIRSRLQDERGSVLVVVAASLVLFLVCAAFVVDIGNARQVARNYQNAADGAALAGAQELDRGQLGAQRAVEFAADYAFQTLLGASRPAEPLAGCSDPLFAGEVPSGGSGAGTPHCFTLGGLRVYVTTPWTDEPADPTPLPGGFAARQINVKVCGKVDTGFARIVNIDFTKPCRVATGMSAFGNGPCALCVRGSLAISGSASASVSGSSAWINADATMSVGASFSAPAGFYVGGNASGFVPPPVIGAPPINDPLAWLPEPRSLQAPWQDWTTLPLHNDTTLECANPGDTVPIDPGIYPSIKVIPRGPRTCDATNTIRLNPGFYVIRHSFEITTDANIVADLPGVTIYFACDSFPENPCGPGEHAYFEHTGNGSITLHASTTPTGHPYNNLLFFFDRNNQTQLNLFSGGGPATNITGTIYGSSARLELSGSGTYNSLFVVGSMQFSGSGLLDLTYNPHQNVPTFLPALIT